MVIFDFGGQVSMVTGAASGIGAQVARSLLRAGSSVLALDLDQAALEERSASWPRADGASCLCVGADVTDAAAVGAAVAQALSAFGRLDNLVHSAGVIDIETVDRTAPTDWEHQVRVNLLGTYLACREASGPMVRAGRGSIVTVSSMLARSGRPGYSAYSASKGAIESFARVLAAEVAPADVRVNTIAPGNITGTALRDHADAISRERGFSVATERVHDIPLGRQGTVQEVADVALFLCSDAASFITGETVNVSGGQVTW
ncbi:SDR family NAD(P)-dependent oxidoreductase [Ornithinimicrobium cavernae]|uniref:SDR family NAD(P)-dependent oxidoreductase n=1 Tax=Ornithinimicrobium cavernae TaxID=2666047 RepID=UPI000D68673F|nr:SDR family NAD(P)-dependent oxidoreductase [Ornithinimicrobium cavernae]